MNYHWILINGNVFLAAVNGTGSGKVVRPITLMTQMYPVEGPKIVVGPSVVEPENIDWEQYRITKGSPLQ